MMEWRLKAKLPYLLHILNEKKENPLEMTNMSNRNCAVNRKKYLQM